MKKKLIICAMLLSSLTACGTATPELSPTVETEKIVETTPVVTEEQKPSIIYYNIGLSEELQQYTYDVCVEAGIPDYYPLVLAVMEHESNFDPSVISATNDYGLMQINICNHDYISEKLGVYDFLDPQQNIKAGVHMLHALLYRNDWSVTKALMCYNMGDTGAKRAWEQGIYSTSYTESVLELYKNYI